MKNDYTSDDVDSKKIGGATPNRTIQSRFGDIEYLPNESDAKLHFISLIWINRTLKLA
jgi:hypothetical protein